MRARCQIPTKALAHLTAFEDKIPENRADYDHNEYFRKYYYEINIIDEREQELTEEYIQV